MNHEYVYGTVKLIWMRSTIHNAVLFPLNSICSFICTVMYIFHYMYVLDFDVYFVCFLIHSL